MPTYFFDIRNGREHIDFVGKECISAQTARGEAAILAAELIRELPESYGELGWTMAVSDCGHRPLFTLAFTAASSSRNFKAGEPLPAPFPPFDF